MPASIHQVTFSLLAQTNNDYVLTMEINHVPTPLVFGAVTTNVVTQIQSTALPSLNKSDPICLARSR